MFWHFQGATASRLTVYLVPIAVVLGLLTTAAVLLPRWRRRRRDAPPQPGGSEPLDAADSARLEAELAAFDR